MPAVESRPRGSDTEESPVSDANFVSITVDPVNDTPEQLRRYAASLNADPKQWRFLSGPMADVQALGQDVFKVTVQGKEHSDRLVLVDRQGQVVGRYSTLQDLQIKAFKLKLRKLLDLNPNASEPATSEEEA